MFAVSADDVEALAGEHGFVAIHCKQREDMLGRSDVHWTFLALRAAPGSAPLATDRRPGEC